MTYDLLATIESLRRRVHSSLDEDCWYSCPKSPDYCGHDTECNCGLDEHNAKVGAISDAATAMIEALDAVEALIGRQWWARPTTSAADLTTEEDGR